MAKDEAMQAIWQCGGGRYRFSQGHNHEGRGQ